MPFARFLAAVFLWAASFAAAADLPLRYTALLSSGKRIESDHLRNWHVSGAVPHLGSSSLLDPANPFRWLRVRSRRQGLEPPAYIEFTNGDRLPGTVVEPQDDEAADSKLPPHLVVRVGIVFEPPYNKPMPQIRVVSHFVRRIVWQRRAGAAYQPGTVFYRDGRAVNFRAVRYKKRGIEVLLADGEREIDWEELAELHLPAVDPWNAWFDQLTLLCPQEDSRLLHVETTSGLIATASVARCAARFEGNSADPDRWVHGLAPAWTLDALWVPFREIVSYDSCARNEVPLSRITPREITHRGLSTIPPLQIDRSVLGAPLRNRNQEFGWGLGVTGGTELKFDLPAGVRSLRTGVCLDQSAGDGGCIRPRVFAADAQGQPLWEGPVLVGNSQVADSGTINLAPVHTLVLQIDPVATGHPRGADPLDIRDYANWCDPLLEFDPAIVQTQIAKRRPTVPQ